MSERSGVDSQDPRDITRQPAGRTVLCPRCRYPFETMRRFLMACPRCGHAWQEESKRSIFDWLSGLPELAASGLFWTAGAFGLLIVLGPIAFAIFVLLYWGVTHQAWGVVGLALFIAALLAALAAPRLGYGRARRARAYSESDQEAQRYLGRPPF
jgi:hypothetical protein